MVRDLLGGRHARFAVTWTLATVALVLALAVGLTPPHDAEAFPPLPVGFIDTVAGDGTNSFGGDGGEATAAQLNIPQGVALDAAGNLYIADTFNHRIRRVDANTNIITTVAGSSSTGGFSGDGGLATDAELNRPTHVAFDAAGNLFIVDSTNQRIRRVDANTNIITTVAGSSLIPGFGGDGGAATDAELNLPIGMAFDASGHLFIVESTGSRVRRVDASTGVITTVAGDGTAAFGGDGGLATVAQLNSPREVAFDAAGNLFIADGFNHRIRRVDAGNQVITTVVGDGTPAFGGDGGPATAAQLFVPTGIVFDAAGNLFIADLGNARIRRVDVTSNVVSTVAGSSTTPGFGGDGGPATAALLSLPIGMTIGGSDLLIAEFGNHRVRRVVLPQPGTIIVVKHSTGGDRRFDFTSSTLGDFGVMTIGGVGTRTFANLDAGTYDVAEAVPFGWELTDASCDDGSVPTQIELGDGETVTCTFSNVDIDADDDGLTDDREALFGTDPFNPDTDGDGVADGQELLVDNTDPRDPTNGEGIGEPGGGEQLPTCPIAPGTFVPGISPHGSTLTQYGGGTVRELQHQLRDAESTSATFTLPDGSTTTLIDTDLPFVIHSFVAPFFGIDVDLEEPAMHGVDSFRDLPITPCRLLFVRALR